MRRRLPPTRRPVLRGPGRLPAALASLGLVAVAAPLAEARQPPSETAGVDLVALSVEVRELRALAVDPDRALEAVLALTRIVEDLESRRGPEADLPELETELLLRASEYRARAELSRGNRDAAADGFRLILLADPAWELDRADLSPAVVEVFDRERSSLVAWLTVRTDPDGAEVRVGGTLVGRTPLLGRPVHAGFLSVVIERVGYGAVEEPRREALPGEIIMIDHTLERSGPVLPVITFPAGVTVRVGGRVVGSTSGSLPEELRPLAPPAFADQEFSAPLELGSLALGANEIVFEAPCRRPTRLTFHADEARDYLPQFVRLQPSTGGLRIESEPGGGTVVLDGEERGATPLSFSAMCSGDHEVEIRHPAGRCARSFRVSRGARTVVRCEIAPVLVLTADPPDQPAARAVREALEAADGFFFSPAPVPVEPQAEIRLVTPERGAGPARVEFLAAGAERPDTAAFDGFEPRTAVAALQSLLASPDRRRPWLGLSATVRRTHAPEGTLRRLEVVSVHPTGPALLAGFEPGDLLVEAGGVAISDEVGFRDGFARESPGRVLEVLARRRDSDRVLRVEVGETPVLPSLSGDRCNRRLVALGGEFARGQDDFGRRLEAAICWILLGDPGRAMLETLGETPEAGPSGIGEGTFLYYRGVALAALGERQRARAAFEAAAAAEGATLVTHDGPLLAPLARRRAEALP